ncbi:hypothetical protein [Hymenobacter volaticus]|uniref:Uncharacterized protein n=1 Tax=Hymenobacter volaticus TaxID=2932254 RepID=A0ABY4GGE9_9BACT|nr:hypothetical protein [Hymenobacter volaticus]UOQ69544.1 hypothetical protein MUN86_28300 [Hymenobacter volaticus]
MTSVSAPSALGELDIPSACDLMYQLGEELACLNAKGRLLPPDFLPDVSLAMPLGKWGLRKSARVQPIAQADLTPEKAAQQFSEFEGVLLQALLAGYGRKAYHVLEPQHPGFTEQLLALLLPAPCHRLPSPAR